MRNPYSALKRWRARVARLTGSPVPQSPASLHAHAARLADAAQRGHYLRRFLKRSRTAHDAHLEALAHRWQLVTAAYTARAGAVPTNWPRIAPPGARPAAPLIDQLTGTRLASPIGEEDL